MSYINAYYKCRIYMSNINIKYRPIDGDLDSENLKKKVYSILLDEMIIVVGKNKFKIFINNNGDYGKIFIKEKEF